MYHPLLAAAHERTPSTAVGCAKIVLQVGKITYQVQEPESWENVQSTAAHTLSCLLLLCFAASMLAGFTQLQKHRRYEWSPQNGLSQKVTQLGRVERTENKYWSAQLG